MSPTTEAVFLAILIAYRETGKPPTYREIKERAGLSSVSVAHYQAQKLIRAKVIRPNLVPSRGNGLACPMCGRTAKGESA